MSLKAIAFSALLVLVTGCQKSSNPNQLATIVSDSMEGCYSYKKDGQPEFKIERQGSNYYASFNKESGWKREDQPLQELAKDDLGKLLKDDLPKLDRALGYSKGAFGLFKFKSGANINGKPVDTDYMVLVFIASGPVYRSNCS